MAVRKVKIVKEEIRECTNSDWTKTDVLELYYTIGKETGRVLLKDYNAESPEDHKLYLDQIISKIHEQYNNYKINLPRKICQDPLK